MSREPKHLPGFVLEALPDLSDSEQRDVADTLGTLSAALCVDALPEGLRERLLESVQKERHAPFLDKLSELFDLGVGQVKHILDSALAGEGWEPSPLPGLMLFHLDGGPSVATADVGLIRIEPGVFFPPHGHLGEERALILEGGYRDSTGAVYGPGDLHVMTPGTQHSYTTLGEGCLLAVVLFEGIEIEGIGRVGIG